MCSELDYKLSQLRLKTGQETIEIYCVKKVMLFGLRNSKLDYNLHKSVETKNWSRKNKQSKKHENSEISDNS